MYTVLPIKWEAAGAALHQVFFCQFLHCSPLAADCHWGDLQIHDLHQGSHNQHINSTHSLILPHGGGDHHCYCRLHQWYGGHTGLRNIHGGRGCPPGFLWLSGPQWSPRTPGGSPSGWPLYLLHPRVLALGSLQMRQTRKHPPGLAILLLRGVDSFMLLWTAVTVPPGFSRFVGYTSYSGCLLRGMNCIHCRYSCLSFTIWLAGVGGPANLSTDTTVGPTGSSNLTGLEPWVADRSFWILALGLATGTVVSSTSGVSTGPDWVSPASVLAGEVVESAGGVPMSSSSASDLYLGDGEMVSSDDWVCVGLSCVSSTSVMAEEVVESAGGVPMSLFLASGAAFPKPSKTSWLLKEVIFLCAALAPLHLSPKGEVHWVLVDWLPLPSIEVPAHRPDSIAEASAGCLDRMGCQGETYPS